MFVCFFCTALFRFACCVQLRCCFFAFFFFLPGSWFREKNKNSASIVSFSDLCVCVCQPTNRPTNKNINNQHHQHHHTYIFTVIPILLVFSPSTVPCYLLSLVIVPSPIAPQSCSHLVHHVKIWTTVRHQVKPPHVAAHLLPTMSTCFTPSCFTTVRHRFPSRSLLRQLLTTSLSLCCTSSTTSVSSITYQ